MNADTAGLHARTMVIDGHADIEIEGRESPYVGADGKSKVAPQKLLAGQVDAVVLSIAASPGPRNAEGYAAARRAADRKNKAVMDMIADHSNPTALATTAEDADRLKA
ncbi:MAG: membrane dipeptidase, partial [Pseudomonadota bacterium]